jgi:ribosomal protein S18 acetylase RimI-like enzyme
VTTLIIRPLGAPDRDPVRAILVRTGAFTDAEIATALELIDEWLDGAEASDYLTYVATVPSGLIVGYVCFGPTPLTEGTYDLYWIAVDPAQQGHGAGRRLLAFAESDVAGRGGRLVLIETSSQASYEPTRQFYERTGYALVARIPDYYRPGDDKLIFSKTVKR